MLLALTLSLSCSNEGGSGSESGTGGSEPLASGGGGTGGAEAGDAGGRGASGGQPTGGDGASTGGSETSGGGSSEAGGAPPGSGGGRSGGSASGGAGENGSGGAGAPDLDVFGITKLYPSTPDGAEWTSAHYEDDYEVAFGTDLRDPSGLSGARGTGKLSVRADGQLVMSGSQPRLYIHSDTTRHFRNVEITVYYQRVSDDGAAYAGLVVGARSGPDGHTTDGACDAHTYYARLRNDGAFDFEKELKHPASSTKSRVAPELAWPPSGEVPRETWLGWKFVLYDLEPGRVKLEAYLDLSEGADGGDWALVNETVDEGGWSVETDCTHHSPIDGSSDLVVQSPGSILIRNTDVTEARYRFISVREIVAQ